MLNELMHDDSEESVCVSCNANVNITRQQTSVFLEFLLCHNQSATHANIRSRMGVGVQTVLFGNYRFRSFQRADDSHCRAS